MHNGVVVAPADSPLLQGSLCTLVSFIPFPFGAPVLWTHCGVKLHAVGFCAFVVTAVGAVLSLGYCHVCTVYVQWGQRFWYGFTVRVGASYYGRDVLILQIAFVIAHPLQYLLVNLAQNYRVSGSVLCTLQLIDLTLLVT